MNFPRQGMSYENFNHSSDPRGLQSQGTLHSQLSPRPVDSAANSITGFYSSDDQSSRFEQPRYNDRMAAATMQGNFAPYDMGSQTWGGGAFAGQGNTQRMKSQSRGRSAIPMGWMEQAPPMPTGSPFLGLGNAGMGPPLGKFNDFGGSEADDDLIPTAIVIKNIPFAVKKEQLVAIMTDLGLPLPYAFNYHFDNGIFRGLAFANFTSADETAQVIDMLNHYDLQGRKLRVEYKKMLPVAERERIEREKRERRGQLEEQHRPMTMPALQTQPSLTSLSNLPGSSPSPVSARAPNAAVDMNDPETLEFYTKLAFFKSSPDDVLVLSPNLTPQQRRIVHTLAHHMGFAHMSKGNGIDRAVHVFKQAPAGERQSPPLAQQSQMTGQPAGRNMGRSATAEFNDIRGNEGALLGLRQQAGNNLYPQQYPNSQASALGSNPNLRAAKSFADLRSYTPSPAQSTASFPASMTNNGQKLQEQGREVVSAITPTMTSGINAFGSRDENFLVNGLAGMNLGNTFGNNPRTLRGMVSWERNPTDNLGTIGGHRSFTANQPEGQSATVRQSQSRGPVGTSSTGFTRQNGTSGPETDDPSRQATPIDHSTVSE